MDMIGLRGRLGRQLLSCLYWLASQPHPEGDARNGTTFQWNPEQSLYDLGS